MSFTLLDWSAIIGYLAITLALGLYFRRSSAKSGELDLVGLSAVRDDDGVPFRPVVAPVRAHDGCSIRGDEILGQACRISSGFPRYLSWLADELHDSRLGDQSND
jgi:hypothetical protein